jgi:hypothetical protein
MDWQQFLESHPRILECQQWLAYGTSEAGAWACEAKAENLLWLAKERGYCDADTLAAVAAALVDRVLPLHDFGVEVDEETQGHDILAVGLLLSDKIEYAPRFAANSKAHEAQAAWCAAMADETATLAEKQELQAGIERVRNLENAAQCAIVREAITCQPS